ncbi:DNA (cytosine-5)-methyltransferase 1 [Methylorubrum rhodinum]|uniref:DNA (cytosine-5-)-methyltransferase n=2 Tax=Methylorubrum rhodinum TaxID=29428 RepID=A0A840ZPJ0_9HYPH|nr:DNA (cytosine-5)-methyltransferase 1 [Methylorubrum rhodinum]
MRGLFAIEHDPMAFESFAANFVEDGAPESVRFDWPSWLERRAWSVAELLERHHADLEELRGSVDIIAGGPPCQGFSLAGQRIENDPRNLLVEKYVEAVKLMRPAALILENVPGMQYAHGTGTLPQAADMRQRRRRSFYDRLAIDLDAVGYEVRATLVDASRFGVPQRRLRLIAIGLRKDLSHWPLDSVGHVFDLIEEARAEQLRDFELGDAVSAADAISDLEIGNRPLVECTDPQSPGGYFQATPAVAATAYQKFMRRGAEDAPDSLRLANHRDEIRLRYEKILQNCQRGVRMNDDDRSLFGLKKHRIHPMSPSEPAPTITTMPDDVLHYAEPRILTVRESARLQSFPDWFRFRGKFTTGGNRRTRECPRYTQVGNAVPPLLARAIGVAVSRALEKFERTHAGAQVERQTKVVGK